MRCASTRKSTAAFRQPHLPVDPAAHDQTILKLIYSTVRIAATLLDTLPGVSDHEQKVTLGQVRAALAQIRRAEGTIQDPEIRQEIRALVNRVQAKLDKV